MQFQDTLCYLSILSEVCITHLFCHVDSPNAHFDSAFALFSSKPMAVVDSLQKAEEHGFHVEALVGETLAN